jgi:hypothetical protein
VILRLTLVVPGSSLFKPIIYRVLLYLFRSKTQTKSIEQKRNFAGAVAL